jgi:hypothetical protein
MLLKVQADCHILEEQNVGLLAAALLLPTAAGLERTERKFLRLSDKQDNSAITIARPNSFHPSSDTQL